MKIDNQDIIRMARQLRDEHNDRLHVRSVFNREKPWHRFPAWLAAIPAAAIVGFVLGLWCHGLTRSDAEPLTALVDTVYIKVPVSQPTKDTIAQVIPTVSTPAQARTIRQPHRQCRPQLSVGRPVADDHIRYDLLVRN